MQNTHNAKYAFYYLLSLAALVFMSVGVGLIAFGIIGQTISDALTANSYNNYDGQFKFAISTLLIATPIFYVISRLISRGLKKKEIGMDSALRRWMIYFILFVSSLIILGVFIGIINNFLSGELTLRFVLKALAIFLISAIIFSFYFYSIKQTVIKKDKVVRCFFWASLVIVVATFVAAWFFVDSPAESRNRRLDQIVVNNIYALESGVNVFYDRHGYLPENLDQLKGEEGIIYNESILVDPETGKTIEYKVISDAEFAFCTDFRTNSIDGPQGRDMIMDNKAHQAGYACLSSQVWSVGKK